MKTCSILLSGMIPSPPTSKLEKGCTIQSKMCVSVEKQKLSTVMQMFQFMTVVKTTEV